MGCSTFSANTHIKIYDEALNQVPKFKYPGSILTEDGKNKEYIIQRVEEVKLCLIIIISNYYVRMTASVI